MLLDWALWKYKQYWNNHTSNAHLHRLFLLLDLSAGEISLQVNCACLHRHNVRAIQVCCAYRDYLENISQILCTLSQLSVLLICIMIGWEEEQGSGAQGDVMDMAMNLGAAPLIFGAMAMRAAVMNITAVISCECCADSIKKEMRDSLGALSINQESLKTFGVANISELTNKLLKAGIELGEDTATQTESVSEAIKSAEAIVPDVADVVIVPDVADVADKGLLDKGTDVALDGLKLLKTTAPILGKEAKSEITRPLKFIDSAKLE